MRFWKRLTTPLAVLAILLTTSLAFVDTADARRGGSFGSRGARTYSTPATTPTAPTATQPMQRSMTQQTAPAATPAAGMQAQRPGFFSGFGGSMLRGLAIGGLIGLLLGHGFGGMAGALGMILQIALLAIGAMFLFRFLANRRPQAPQAAMASGPSYRDAPEDPAPARPAFGGLGGFGLGGGSVDARPPRPANARNANDEVGILDSDLDTFEQLLTKVQTAFGKEDYAGLRALTTPEIMSYLSEELSQNATSGVRNDVTDVKLLQGDLAEAWREGDSDYATVAMRYESHDVMRDRKDGLVVSGDESRPSETTELWTFIRTAGGDWKLSAIQEA
ncbi:Predicted lipid-binding transport protein, Tim44 family [Kaistia soli DSM 19436]|uniref:Predicted lipid-binding transport protein, Tim44 family n=1 Tax=Kaistia soli DSM 19436 TaxID=1122133 RepID=A0A1M4UBT3_9HYPH|nr:Tim44 domain-containing protein [Kaistia soli]SHE54106.1 Predicted lipid-binding transport protein, Tim44 family [Kaistia soli DSM 19436]